MKEENEQRVVSFICFVNLCPFVLFVSFLRSSSFHASFVLFSHSLHCKRGANKRETKGTKEPNIMGIQLNFLVVLRFS